MKCKLSKVILALCAIGLVLQTTEAIIFTLGGLTLDSSLAVFIFEKFLHFPLIFAKRSVDIPATEGPLLGPSATAEQYLAVATSIDTNRCLLLSVCGALFRSKNPAVKLTPFDSMVVQSFSGRIGDSLGHDKTPLDIYTNAAESGLKFSRIEECQSLGTNCNHTMEELYKITQAV